jgi:NAD(P)H dehydrogenase (quinone)
LIGINNYSPFKQNKTRTIVTAPGYTHNAIFGAGGNPYGTSATSGREGIKIDAKEAAIYQGERTTTVAKWLKTGMKQS